MEVSGAGCSAHGRPKARGPPLGYWPLTSQECGESQVLPSEFSFRVCSGGYYKGLGANSPCVGFSVLTPGATSNWPVVWGRVVGRGCFITSRPGFPGPHLLPVFTLGPTGFQVLGLDIALVT